MLRRRLLHRVCDDESLGTSKSRKARRISTCLVRLEPVTGKMTSRSISLSGPAVPRAYEPNKMTCSGSKRSTRRCTFCGARRNLRIVTDHLGREHNDPRSNRPSLYAGRSRIFVNPIDRRDGPLRKLGDVLPHFRNLLRAQAIDDLMQLFYGRDRGAHGDGLLIALNYARFSNRLNPDAARGLLILLEVFEIDEINF